MQRLLSLPIIFFPHCLSKHFLSSLDLNSSSENVNSVRLSTIHNWPFSFKCISCFLGCNARNLMLISWFQCPLFLSFFPPSLSLSLLPPVLDNFNRPLVSQLCLCDRLVLFFYSSECVFDSQHFCVRSFDLCSSFFFRWLILIRLFQFLLGDKIFFLLFSLSQSAFLLLLLQRCVTWIRTGCASSWNTKKNLFQFSY